MSGRPNPQSRSGKKGKHAAHCTVRVGAPRCAHQNVGSAHSCKNMARDPARPTDQTVHGTVLPIHRLSGPGYLAQQQASVVNQKGHGPFLFFPRVATTTSASGWRRVRKGSHSRLMDVRVEVPEDTISETRTSPSRHTTTVQGT